MKRFKLTQVREVYQTCIVEAETREAALKVWMDGMDDFGQWNDSSLGEVDRIISVDELVVNGEDITNDVVGVEFVD